MFKKKWSISFSILLVLTISPLSARGQWLPTDKKSTVATRQLYKRLQKLSSQGVMFGHQDDLASGVDWKELDGRSDTQEITGDFPAVFGWDLGLLEVNKVRNFDYVSFDKIRGYIIKTSQSGGINTISWHSNNPSNPSQMVRTVKGSPPAISALFSDSVLLENYKGWLDKIAGFMLSLKASDGTLVPIIFRPFHENTGSWFWWGKDQCTAEEYIRLWRFTVDYLRHTKHVHNLLYAYSTDRFRSEQEYLERYPGDGYVDILGFDCYASASDTNGTRFRQEAGDMIAILKKLGIKKKKVLAFTETGAKLVPQGDWWTKSLLPVLRDSHLSYVLLWRNGSRTSHWGAYAGHPSAPDFLKFYENNITLFENDVKRKKKSKR